MSGCTAILLAAGRSRRLGFDKILTPLCGRPVLSYSLQCLAECDAVTEIRLVTRKDIFGAIEALVEPFRNRKEILLVEGGQERQDSVQAGLKTVPVASGYVLIHDAARPLLTTSMIEKTLAAAKEKGAVVAAHRATDTLKEVDDTGCIGKTIDRSRIWQMETPQVFEKELITRAYQTVIDQKMAVTDDASTVELTGGKVHVVESDMLNLKITRPMDWEVLELWLGRQQGSGLRKDVHELSNHLNPLVGYLPLLEKYAGGDEKFAAYFQKCQQASRSVQQALHSLQNRVRTLYPDSNPEELS